MILMTGATGFVGRAMLRRVLELGEPVRALVRAPARADLPPHPKLQVVEGNLCRPQSLSGAFHGIDTVIHLVGILIENGASTFERIHIQGTETMVGFSRGAGVKRYLQMSSLGTRPDARSRYHQTKWAAEEAVRKSGLAFTIFRPSVIFGAEDKFTNLFARIIERSPILPIIGPGTNRLQPIWIENVVDYFLQALGNGQTERKTYELGGPMVFSMERLLDLIMKIKGKKRIKIHVPQGVARFQAAFLEKLLTRPPFTRDQLLMLEEHNIVGDPKPLKDFSVRPAPLEEILPTYLLRPRKAGPSSG